MLAPSALKADTPKSLPALPSNPVTPTAMPTRNLGKTGYKVGIFSLGGQAALEHPNNFDVAVPIIERALDLGVNYIDTSSIYGGPSAGASNTWAKNGSPSQPGLPGHQDQGTHPRRLHAHDREVAATAANRSRRPVATARHRHHDRCQ